VQSLDLHTPFPLAVKQLKGATQDHLDGAWKVDGAELYQVEIFGNALKVQEQSTLTKFDVEDSMGVVDPLIRLVLGFTTHHYLAPSTHVEGGRRAQRGAPRVQRNSRFIKFGFRFWEKQLTTMESP
jgi:hypothetical protein